MNKIFPTLLDILVRNMLYLLLRRWSIVFELFFPEISDKCQSRRAPNDLCDLYATCMQPSVFCFVPTSKYPKVHSNQLFSHFLSFSEYRGRVVTGHRRKFALAVLSILQQSSKKKQAFRFLFLSLWKRILCHRSIVILQRTYSVSSKALINNYC